MVYHLYHRWMEMLFCVFWYIKTINCYHQLMSLIRYRIIYPQGIQILKRYSNITLEYHSRKTESMNETTELYNRMMHQYKHHFSLHITSIFSLVETSATSWPLNGWLSKLPKGIMMFVVSTGWCFNNMSKPACYY